MIWSAKKRAIKLPVTKKGPKGISSLNFLLPKITNIIPIVAPIKKEKNKAIKVAEPCKKVPIRKAILTSPKPIQRPLETVTIKRKKALAKIAENNEFSKRLKHSA